MNWNKDDITDFAHELDQHRRAESRGKLSDECTRFLRAYILCNLPDDQLQFFEQELLALGLQYLKQIYDDNCADIGGWNSQLK